MNPQLNPRRITAVTIILVSLGCLFFGIRSHVTSAQSQIQVASANSPSAAQGTDRTNGPLDSPVGWRASYTQIYFDDVESLQPTVGPQFVLGSAGALTNASGEVITGTRSIKGSYTGSSSFTPYLRTNSAVLSFTPSQTYRVTFTYKILVAPDRGFECLFISPTAAAAGNFLQSITINGQAGSTGTATLANTLGPYSDYNALWNIVGTGAIVIDDIRIEQLPAGQTVATEDGERSAPSVSSGLRLSGSANVTTDPSQVVAGAASVRLTNFGRLETDPAVLPLSSNTYYAVEFKYRILNRGTDNQIAFVNLQPAGSNDQSLSISSGGLLKNAEATSTFSTGALTASAASYVLRINAAQNAVIAVDDIRLTRIDPTQISSQPAAWTALASRPYPRLGNCQRGTTIGFVGGSPGEGVPFAYTAQQFEDRLAFADVVAGEEVSAQTQDSDFVRRLQRKNPNIVVMPYRISEEQNIIPTQRAPTGATVDLDWQFQGGLDSSWFARDTHGNQISEFDFPDIRIMDVSPYCPVVNGNNFISYQHDWMTQKVLRSGIWDGIFLDNLFAQINTHIPNFLNGSLLDIDINRNGLRDETPASVSDIYRTGGKQILQSIRAEQGDLTLVMGNEGPQPELALAPYLNGYLFECVNGEWNAPYLSTGFSEPGWRSILDDYLAAQAGTRLPHTNILEGCGRHHGLTPTAQDIRDERMVMGTALLSDGFAEYDLFDSTSAPYWFDEYSVDGTGTAVEDRRYKGYLGNALGPAMELKSPATDVWVENFESTFPSALTTGYPANVYISHAAGEVIAGGGSLVLDNPKHDGTLDVDVRTNANQVPLSGGHTYVFEFDWRILETLDDHVQVDIYNQSNGGAGSYSMRNSIVVGDSGKAHFPVTLQLGTGYQIAFRLIKGGKVAIDNIRVTDGGAGPWRRDFEHGLVIINPLNRPYTFTATELAGAYNKTGIKRILGTQDSVTNNGQPVTGSFTIGPADAIILLSDQTGFGISGQVKDASGVGINGVTVTLTVLSGGQTGTTMTDANGNYSFANVQGGSNYLVTPSSGSYSFSPANQTFNNLNVDRIANFVGTQTVVSIAGTVTDSNNVGAGNVTIALTKNGVATATVQTDAGGNYSFGNLAAGANYVVTPAGSFTPSSQTFTSLTVNATASFKVAPSIPSQCNSTNFAAATNFAVGPNPQSVTAADFNGDGKLDLAVANRGSNNVSVLLGDGVGGFGAATNFAVGTEPFTVAVGDFNRDGRLDLAVTNRLSNNVSVLLGNGAGSFGAATNFAVSAKPLRVAVGDFNSDGKLDLAVGYDTLPNVSVLLGNGAGGFAAPTDFAAGTDTGGVTAADLNGDGKLDLAVPNFDSNNVSVLLGNGAGGFGAATNFAVGTNPTSVVAGDFNGDGKLDLAVGYFSSNNVSVLLGNGAGSFGTATNFAAGTNPAGVAVGDFNGDGKLDLAVANFGSNNVSLLLGNGAGGFAAPTNFGVGAVPQSVAVGDFNGDGKLDLVSGNFNSANISVLLNNGIICNTQTSLTISGQITDAGNKPLSDLAVTLSGPISRVVQTDASGNYSFPSLVPGGNYTVTVQTPYFVITPSRADFFNLSSSQTANFIAAPVAVPSPTPPASDDFTSPTRDANKWTLGTATEPAGATDPQVNLSQINGQLVITPLTQASGMHFNGYVSANSFDLRGGSAGVELVKAATGGADTTFSVGTDSDNFFRFVVHTPGAPTSLAPVAKDIYGIERPLDATTPQLIFQVKIGGQLTSLNIPYDPVADRFMRFRHEPPTNSIVFETSPNNIDFTVQNRVVLQKGVSALTAELSAGTSNPANPGQTIFDNFNLVTSTFQFSAAGYNVGEGDGSVVITVTRAGSTTDAASVDFATADGTALQRSKYINAAGRLTFGPGQASKTFTVLIEDNYLAEGDETVNLFLTNPVGSGLNSPGRAVLTIVDNDTVLPTTNSLDDARLFVTQHYYDFLNRVPDTDGLNYWTSQITQCGSDQACIRAKRIDVSNAFFYELEFQKTGAYVYRLYRAAYGNTQPLANPNSDSHFPNEEKKLPSYAVFAQDRAQVVGGSGLAQSQLDLANAFVGRAEFVAKYPASLATAGQFVDAVLATIKNDIGVDLSSQGPALITLFNSSGRGGVLYRLADDNIQTNPINNRALIDAEYNRAFVYTQYAGYLRRDSDVGGFLFWLGQVNNGPLRSGTKQHGMVCAFITSAEYQQRFSSVATHSNAECPQ